MFILEVSQGDLRQQASVVPSSVHIANTLIFVCYFPPQNVWKESHPCRVKHKLITVCLVYLSSLLSDQDSRISLCPLTVWSVLLGLALNSDPVLTGKHDPLTLLSNLILFMHLGIQSSS